MDCAQAREGLWPPERPRLAGEDVVEARRHVETCDACQDYFAQDRALLDAYDRLHRQQAPTPVRERVFRELARERMHGAPAPPPRPEHAMAPPRQRTGIDGRWAVAALSVFALAAWIYLRSANPVGGDAVATPQPADAAVLFAEDYLRRAVSQDRLVTDDPVEVTRFLMRELGLGVALLAGRDLNVAGVEICLLAGRRGAMVMYQVDGHVLSHYLVPRDGARARPPATAPTEGSVTIVTWATPSLEQALVAQLPPQLLLSIAQRAKL
ncbi:MAG: hypothetical protein HY561_02615 [Gemmatimonadetes bacterium]|nr:hypothetical protein [Gemmatimonadota bacterium]